MSSRRTRDRQLRKLHERRYTERRRQRRQRTLTLLVASVLVVALAVGLVLVLSGRGKQPSANPSPHRTTPTPTAAPSPGSKCGYIANAGEDSGKKGTQPVPTFTIDVNKTYKATVVTSMGTFVATLDAKAAPCAVNSFVYLAKRHFFDGLIFHRVIKGFVIQGGDPTGTGAGGPGYKFNDELHNGLVYNVGSLAMANSGPNTNGSQWFVVTGEQGVALPNNYTIFGLVTKGLPVPLKIQQVKTHTAGSQSDLPVTPVTIDKITIAVS